MQLPALYQRSAQRSDQSASTKTLASQSIGFLDTLRSPANLFINNLNKTRNNMKSQIPKKKKEKKRNGGIVELLIPAFFQKKLLMRGQKLF